MYFETHSVTSDRQGRINFPRNLFRDSGISRGGTVCVYPMESYWLACDIQRFQQILESEYPGSSLDPVVRDSRREFMLDAKSLHIDPQGRVPFQAVDGRKPGTEYLIIGTGLEFEIWPKSVWLEHTQDLGGNDDE